MRSRREGRVLYLVVCAAGPASNVHTLVESAIRDGWDTYVIGTPSSLDFLDAGALQAQTGHTVRCSYRSPDEPREPMPRADVVVVAPATYNTVNKFAAGVSDNYALGVLAESLGAGVPTVILPFVNTALAARRPFRASVAALRDEGVRVLTGEHGNLPHSPGEGTHRIAAFPWTLALAEADRLSPDVLSE